MSDASIQRLRAQIAEQDRVVVDAVNARLRLVAELKRHKDDAGIEFVDPEQEERRWSETLFWEESLAQA